MYAEERQATILSKARAQGRVDVLTLAEVLGVTAETVRRDLTALERRGVVRRVHGGALPVERLLSEPTVATKRAHNADEKTRIAERAVRELPERGTILLDSGTTTLALAGMIPADSRLTVVTNSIDIASQLASAPKIDLLILGGRVRQRTGAAVGEWMTDALAAINVDVAFLGTNGFTVERGLTTPDQAEAAAKHAMVGAARRLVVMADSSKAGQVHLHRFAEPHDIALLISDTGLDQDTVEEFDAAGVEVALA
ncbi:MAG: D-beta-D-heptose 1-phosphate adenosyltransferase [Actinobacteria bacterium HGW-Actinobacteria-4]|nr:MAG: D-beta-D-heptose 1-phosphate adenosyltransferase [Actinobacteria bacterium HGW-Actinobacteria-4]